MAPRRYRRSHKPLRSSYQQRYGELYDETFKKVLVPAFRYVLGDLPDGVEMMRVEKMLKDRFHRVMLEGTVALNRRTRAKRKEFIFAKRRRHYRKFGRRVRFLRKFIKD